MNLLLSPIKKILDFIVYSNILISVGAALFTLQTAIIFPNLFDEIMEFILPNFISTFILYNLQRLYYSAKHPENKKYYWYTKHRRLIFTLIILTLICSFNFLWHFYLNNPIVLFAYAFLGGLSLFYFLPPVQLRKHGILKPFIITVVFICTCIILPLLTKLSLQVLIYALSQFCFISALCVLFDIRDVGHDSEANVDTIPVKFGITTTKYLIVFLVFMYATISLFVNQTNMFITSGIISAIMLLLTAFSKPSRHNYFYLFLVDGLIILQCVMLLLMNK